MFSEMFCCWEYFLGLCTPLLISQEHRVRANIKGKILLLDNRQWLSCRSLCLAQCVPELEQVPSCWQALAFVGACFREWHLTLCFNIALRGFRSTHMQCRHSKLALPALQPSRSSAVARIGQMMIFNDCSIDKQTQRSIALLLRYRNTVQLINIRLDM